MNNKVKVFVEGFGEVYIEEDATLEDLSKKIYGEEYKNYLSARIDNEVIYLNQKVEEGKYIKFLDIQDKDGHRIYGRTLSIIFIKPVKICFLIVM